MQQGLVVCHVQWNTCAIKSDNMQNSVILKKNANEAIFLKITPKNINWIYIQNVTYFYTNIKISLIIVDNSC